MSLTLFTSLVSSRKPAQGPWQMGSECMGAGLEVVDSDNSTNHLLPRDITSTEFSGGFLFTSLNKD